MTVTAESNWPAIARLFDARTARAMALLLQAEGIPVKVTPAVSGLLGAPMWQVQVASDQLDVALVLIENSRFTDAELNYLATGLLGGEDR
jgi:hypothetical protein